MSPLLVRPHAPDAEGVVVDVTPASAGWTYVGFRVVRLAAGERYDAREAGREACIVVLSGSVAAEADGERFALGGRASVFEPVGASLYLPANAPYTLVAGGAAEVAICTAPGTGAGIVQVIAADAVGRETRGTGTNTRHVRNILPDTSDIAESLLVVEVVTPGGHWSSYPPHKHDRDALPEESLLEETYYHRLNPPQGFAFQRVYTDDRSLDEALAVQDGDVVLVPRGYHPVGAAHGYDLYYLNVMAGPSRRWVFANDPAHAWIMGK
ncbi:5-deoxy-glucuronate isomerase [uncultured Sphingomonas sp.]|uniref:5-deoxy-glucuronate isomerase n=1 Tax=uncultured Sphingomonas sp. TaxID=158754 RepID=UPI0035CA71F1